MVINIIILLFYFLIFPHKVYAEASVIVLGSVDDLLWSIVKTIQYYSLPSMALGLAGLGIRLVTSGDDTQLKTTIKSWMIKILTGGIIIFGASTIASILKTAVGG